VNSKSAILYNASMLKKKIRMFCLGWHLKVSGAMHAMLSDPLLSFFEIDFASWNGYEPLPVEKLQGEDASAFVFFQLPPHSSQIEKINLPVFWVPMWDHFLRLPKDFL